MTITAMYLTYQELHSAILARNDSRITATAARTSRPHHQLISHVMMMELPEIEYFLTCAPLYRNKVYGIVLWNPHGIHDPHELRTTMTDQSIDTLVKIATKTIKDFPKTGAPMSASNLRRIPMIQEMILEIQSRFSMTDNSSFETLISVGRLVIRRGIIELHSTICQWIDSIEKGVSHIFRSMFDAVIKCPHPEMVRYYLEKYRAHGHSEQGKWICDMIAKPRVWPAIRDLYPQGSIAADRLFTPEFMVGKEAIDAEHVLDVAATLAPEILLTIDTALSQDDQAMSVLERLYCLRAEYIATLHGNARNREFNRIGARSYHYSSNTSPSWRDVLGLRPEIESLSELDQLIATVDRAYQTVKSCITHDMPVTCGMWLQELHKCYTRALTKCTSSHLEAITNRCITASQECDLVDVPPLCLVYFLSDQLDRCNNERLTDHLQSMFPDDYLAELTSERKPISSTYRVVASRAYRASPHATRCRDLWIAVSGHRSYGWSRKQLDVIEQAVHHLHSRSRAKSARSVVRDHAAQ